MLDSETKRHIDTARDILVGSVGVSPNSVPDPKSQVEQITIALIYKFMDDMDKESVSLGGKASFFSGTYKKYAWSAIFDPRVGGVEMLGLYGDAITKMSENPNLPELFRNIFKNADLPYRDPEPLKLFLKTINEFHYDHSEDGASEDALGDAFEYLLSVLGSVVGEANFGDAGQFRTPRHIIDFMVDVVDPQKNETIIDPACGTAGFLISSYKHIIKADPGAKSKKLYGNFKGYDISPDMVRLSLVNMYLHGFVAPQIYEYDTLTSLDHWNEYADVIMANPPFMSPKGGIIPHKRFQVQAKKSEVLFVDYIAEHLTPTGRAAVIVPEGIIFQSGKAYQALRKMLVEGYLYAVVSLPAGVFNPYSGVKTSILFMDKGLCTKLDTVLFVTVKNDGFDLGAQRRPVEGSDLTAALEALRKFRDRRKLTKWGESRALIVSRDKIAASGDYNLTGERYRVVERRGKQKWPMVRLGDVCVVIAGQSPEGQYYNEEAKGTPFYQGKTEFRDRYIGEPVKWATQETRIAEKGDILMSVRAPVGPVNIATQRICIGRGLAAIRVSNKILQPYLFSLLKTHEDKIHGNGGYVFDSINRKDIEAIEIPLPPLPVQQEIVTEVEACQRVIDHARGLVEAWKPRIEVDPEWPVVKLGDVCEVDGSITKSIKPDLIYIGADSIESNTGKLIQKKTAKEQNCIGPIYHFTGDVVLYSKIRPYLNKLSLTDFEGYCSSDMYPLKFSKNVNQLYALYFMLSDNFNNSIKGFYERASIPKINRTQLFSVDFPLPPLAVQQQIVAGIEEERKAVEGCRALAEHYEARIGRIIGRVWGEE
ncbi:MAG: N-6 DNA methylase [Spirochaetaceae bacterium]|jgi:type I restriction enzyme M protein|nr:N-6 DNA methylase [Spirochaetaceae bacterium]